MNNAKTPLMLLFMLILCMATVKAFALSYDDFFVVNATEKIQLIPFQQNTTAAICFENNCTLMTNHSGYYSISLTNHFRNDTLFIVYANDSNTLVNQTFTGTMKWRVPFTLDISLYKPNRSDSSVSELYKDDFTYIYMRFGSLNNYTNSFSFASMGFLDDAFSWVPYYKKSFTTKMDTKQSFWCNYIAGHCDITLYENGTYDLYVLKTKSKLSINYWEYEFIKPQNFEASFDTLLVNDFTIPKEEDGTMTLYASLWEVNKSQMLWNFFYYFIAAGIWLAVIIMIFCVAPMYAPQAIVGFTIGYLIILKIIGWLYL